MLANIFIAALNELFSAAVEKIMIEMEDQTYDPIDYVLLNAKEGFWKLLKKINDIVNRKKENVEADSKEQA